MNNYGTLYQQISVYQPCNEQEKVDQAQILYLMEQYDDLLWRTNALVHFTASGLVINRQQNKVLMVYHHIYHSWSWTGGHADGDTDLLAKAIEEAQEETGLSEVRPFFEQLAAIDILSVQGHWKKKSYISTHLHLNCAYLLWADDMLPLSHCQAENSAAAWLMIDQMAQCIQEPLMLPVYQKLLNRLPKA